MSKKKKNPKSTWINPSEELIFKKQLKILRENKRKIVEDHELYFCEKQNQIDVNKYYRSALNIEAEGQLLFYKFQELLNKTHTNYIPYFISKDLYLYTWVDLYPDGSVKSIYSGEKRDPESLIIQDHETIRRKYEQYQRNIRNVHQDKFSSLKELKALEWKFKLNTEHIVPQSWFGALEPMKGDLHHLFICEPNCNIIRSNYPYADFTFYQPESLEEPINNHCGITYNGRFEPEHGKGPAARAMLYFLLHYPKAIKKVFRVEIDIPLLVRWHLEFPVTLYEKHRNLAIYQIQGNRNPFIDLPDLAERLYFPGYM